MHEILLWLKFEAVVYVQEDDKKIFQTPSSKFEGRGGPGLSGKKIFLSKKIFFDMKNIENSVSKTLRQKLKQV